MPVMDGSETPEALWETSPDYESPLMSYNSGKSLFNSIAVPYFRASVRGDADAIRALNALEPSAGEYLRPTLELVEDFMRHDYVRIRIHRRFAPFSRTHYR